MLKIYNLYELESSSTILNIKRRLILLLSKNKLYQLNYKTKTCFVVPLYLEDKITLCQVGRKNKIFLLLLNGNKLVLFSRPFYMIYNTLKYKVKVHHIDFSNSTSSFMAITRFYIDIWSLKQNVQMELLNSIKLTDGLPLDISYSLDDNEIFFISKSGIIYVYLFKTNKLRQLKLQVRSKTQMLKINTRFLLLKFLEAQEVILQKIVFIIFKDSKILKLMQIKSGGKSLSYNKKWVISKKIKFHFKGFNISSISFDSCYYLIGVLYNNNFIGIYSSYNLKLLIRILFNKIQFAYLILNYNNLFINRRDKTLMLVIGLQDLNIVFLGITNKSKIKKSLLTFDNKFILIYYYDGIMKIKKIRTVSQDFCILNNNYILNELVMYNNSYNFIGLTPRTSLIVYSLLQTRVCKIIKNKYFCSYTKIGIDSKDKVCLYRLVSFFNNQLQFYLCHITV